MSRIRASAIRMFLGALVLPMLGSWPAGASGQGPLQEIGGISTGDDVFPAAIDTGLRLLIAPGNSSVVRLIDVTSMRVVRSVDTPLPIGNPAVDVDEVHHRVFISAAPNPFPPIGSAPQPPSLLVLNLGSGSDPVSTFALPGDSAGQSITGLGYFAPANRLYVVTQTMSALRDTIDPAAGESRVALYELDADKITSDPANAVVWSYSLAGCATVITRNARPGWVMRSRTADVVSLPCFSAGLPKDRVAIVSVHMRPGAGPSDTSNFSPEFDYLDATITTQQGFTVLDRTGERVLIMATAGGQQKLYVFDVAHGAWIGSVPLGGGNILSGGSDPWTGRIYVLQESSSADLKYAALITEGSWIPTPQGKPQLLSVGSGFGLLIVDPVTRRIFARSVENQGLTVLRDLSVSSSPPLLSSPDLRTDGVPEVPGKTESGFSSGGAAYGFRYTLAGGLAWKYGGRGSDTLGTYAQLYSAAYGPLNDALQGSPLRDAWTGSGASSKNSPIMPYGGPSAFTFGQVSNVFVDTSSAKARAISADADSGTHGDVAQARDIFAVPEPFPSPTGSPDPDQVRQAKESANTASSTATGQARSAATWPYLPAECVDFGGDDDVRSANSKGAGAACDSIAPRATGNARAIAEMGDLPVQVGYGTSSVTATRDAAGMHVVSTALAKNIDIAGVVSIGEITSTAEVAAFGRPGTTHSRLIRTMKEVVVRDASGAPAYSCGFLNHEPCDPFTVADTVNRYHGPNIILRVPEAETDPRLVATPGGVQALVTKSEPQYWNDFNTLADSTYELPALVITVYEDDDFPHVIQLAAVEADAHYTVKKLSDAGDGGSGGGTTIIQQIINSPFAPPQPPTYVLPADYGRSDRGPFVLIRKAARGIGFALAHPRDGILFGLFWLLGGAPIYLAVRRRSLSAV